MWLPFDRPSETKEEKPAQSAPEISSALNGLGLSDSEAAVYQASLASGGMRPASLIAKKAGLKRAHTYNVLEMLKEKGIVQETIKNNIRHFSALPPGSLLRMMENQLDDLGRKKKVLENVIPFLENLQNPFFKQAKVRLFQGKEGLREIFEDILRTGCDMYSIVDLQHSWSSFDEESRHWIANFIARREERKICWHAIAVRSELSDYELKWRSAARREVKMLQGVTIPAEVNIYGSKVALTSTNHEMIGALIENEPISQTMLNLHHFLWSILPDYASDAPAETAKLGPPLSA